MMRFAARFAICWLMLPSAHGATVTVTLTGIHNDHGLVRALVCTMDTFTTRNCQYAGAVRAHPGRVTIVFPDIPPRQYAVQAYHDEDGGGRLRRGLFGIPTEAIGFSRDAPLRLGPPNFSDAVITVTDPATETTIRLHHVDR